MELGEKRNQFLDTLKTNQLAFNKSIKQKEEEIINLVNLNEIDKYETYSAYIRTLEDELKTHLNDSVDYNEQENLFSIQLTV